MWYTAVRTDLFASKILRGEGLIDLNEVQILQRESGNFERLVDSRHGSVAHNRRVNSDGRIGHNARKRAEFVLLDCFFARENDTAGAVTDTRCVSSRYKSLKQYSKSEHVSSFQKIDRDMHVCLFSCHAILDSSRLRTQSAALDHLR